MAISLFVNNGRSCLFRELFETSLIIETENLDLRVVCFEKTKKKNQKHGSNIPTRDFFEGCRQRGQVKKRL